MKKRLFVTDTSRFGGQPIRSRLASSDSSRELLPVPSPYELINPHSLTKWWPPQPDTVIHLAGHTFATLSLSRLDSHLDRNYEWRDLALVFHVINNRREDFVGCSWLNAQTTVSRYSEVSHVERTP